MKRTEAALDIDVVMNCPHCDYFINYLDHLSVSEDLLEMAMDGDSLGCDECEIEVECPECKKLFIVEKIIY
jgi:hypothetical protein